MGKIYSIVFVILTFLVIGQSNSVYAGSIAGESAQMNLLANQTVSPQSAANSAYYSKKKAIIKRVLEKYNSPMVGSVDAFIEACSKYNLDCYLLPSIAGVESFFGTQVLPGSNNAFGWDRGYMMFKNWDDGILTVGEGLRKNYIDKGATSIEQIGTIYCESNLWAGKVNNIHSWFEAEEQNYGLYFARNSVQL